MDVCRNVRNTCKVCGSSIGYVYDAEKVEKLGVWVYSGIATDSMFSRFDTIADAVRAAIVRSNAKVILRGDIIEYGMVDYNRAYYIDNKTGVVKVVLLDNRMQGRM